MKNRHPFRSFIVSMGLTTLACAGTASAGETNLVGNGDFEKGTDWAEGWSRPKSGGTLEKEGSNKFVRLTSSTAGEQILLYCAVPVDSKHKAYELSYRIRTSKLKPGEQPWFDARVIVNFKDESGEKYSSPAPFFLKKDSKDWVEKKIQFAVPEGATKLEILAGLFQVESGVLDIDDILLTPIEPSKVK